MELARELLAKLNKAGFENVVVAGGYVRDLEFGIKPKDIDVVVLDNGDDSKMDAKEIVEKLFHAGYDSYYIKVEDGYAFGDRSYPVDHCLHVVSFMYKFKAVDLIVYKHKTMKPTDVTNYFDFNINQGFIALDEHLRPDITQLIVTNPDHVTEERRERFEKMVRDHRLKENGNT